MQCEGHDDTVDFEGDFGAVGRIEGTRRGQLLLLSAAAEKARLIRRRGLLRVCLIHRWLLQLLVALGRLLG